MNDTTGPWVTMAVFCQRVEPREDGTVDVVGIVDGVIVDDPGADVGAAAPVALTVLLSIRAGDQRGAHTLALRSRYPSRRTGPGLEREIVLTDDTPAATLVVPLELEVDEAGTYELDAYFDQRFLTRMSLWVGFDVAGGSPGGLNGAGVGALGD